MSKKNPTKHKATEERTTLLFFFPKTEKHQRSQSPRKQSNVHTRGERASERDNERREKTVRLPIASRYPSEGSTTPSYQSCSVTNSTRIQIPRVREQRPVTNSVRYQTCSVVIEGEGERPVTGYQSERSRETERRRTGRRAGASVVFFAELQTLVTGGWFCTGFLGERCEFLHFGGRCIVGLSLLLVSISLRSAFTDSATFFGRIFQRAQFKLSLRGFINFCNLLIHVSTVFVGSELVCSVMHEHWCKTFADPSFASGKFTQVGSSWINFCVVQVICMIDPFLTRN